MSDPSAGPETLEWKVFLLGRHPWRGLLTAAVMALTLWFIQSYGRSPWVTGLALFILLASFSSFLFPTRYRLDVTHVTARNPFYWRRRAWREFRAYSRAGDRVNLRTLPHESRLDHYRGMLLILDPDRREEILAFVERRLEEAGHGPS